MKEMKEATAVTNENEYAVYEHRDDRTVTYLARKLEDGTYEVKDPESGQTFWMYADVFETTYYPKASPAASTPVESSEEGAADGE